MESTTKKTIRNQRKISENSFVLPNNIKQSGYFDKQTLGGCGGDGLKLWLPGMGCAPGKGREKNRHEL